MTAVILATFETQNGFHNITTTDNTIIVESVIKYIALNIIDYSDTLLYKSLYLGANNLAV